MVLDLPRCNGNGPGKQNYMDKELTLPTEKITWTISNIVNLHKNGKLVINNEYQRSTVWNPPKKQLLIDSILRDYDIGSVILRQKEDKWEILDGQQRIKAIMDFIAGEFPLRSGGENGGKRWDELEPSIQWGKFMNRLVYTTKVYSVDDETTSMIFLRVQEGMPLNAAEKLNAMRGELRNRVYEISRHPFFRKTGINEYRFAFRYLAAQIVLQEDDGGIERHAFKDAKLVNLKELYLKYKKKLPVGVLEHVNSNLRFMDTWYGPIAKIIDKKSELSQRC
jgi:hypothetical protein